MNTENDYDLDKKIKIRFEGMDYYVMPRYKEHYVENEYEKFSLRLLRSLLNENMTLLDIGAHYGAFSLYSSSKTRCKVIAVEPVKENYEILKLNVKTNNLTSSIEVINCAASDHDGETELNIPWASDSAGFYKHPLADTIKKQKVDVKSMDNLLMGQKVDVIKIDTEGHELNVLNGLRKSLMSNPRLILLIEANPSTLKPAGHTVDDLINEMAILGKVAYLVDEKNFSLYRISEHNPWTKYITRDGYANILFMPKDGNQYGLFVSHSSDRGGAEMAMIDIIESLKNENIVSHVILPSDGPLKTLLIDKGISHSIIGPYYYWAATKDNKFATEGEGLIESIKSSIEIVDEARTINPSFVVNNSLVNPWAYPAAKILDLPLVWFIHEFGDLDHNFEFPISIGRYRKFIVNQSELVLCCSQAVKNSLPSSSKIKQIYFPIDTSMVLDLSMEKITNPFTKNSPIKLVIVGRVSPSKGQIYAIEAISELKKKNVIAELAVVGHLERKYKKALFHRIKELDVEKQIKFLGYKENPYPYMKAADIVLICSINEAFGRVTAEAMILNKPVIGSNAGGTKEMIENNKTGFLVKVADANALAEKIIEVHQKPTGKIISTANERILKLLDIKNTSKKIANQINNNLKPLVNNYDPIFLRGSADAILDLEEKLSNTESKLNLANIEINRLKQTEEDYQKIVNSRSWKVTKPLRSVNKQIGRRDDQSQK